MDAGGERGPIEAVNLVENENLVVNLVVGDDEVDSDEEIIGGNLPQRRHIGRNNLDGEAWQAAAVANVAGESLRLRSRRWEKYVDMLLRLPFLYLLDQILLQDMGWNGFKNHTKNNFTSQTIKMDGSPQENSDSNIQFQFTSDPNFTARKNAFLMAKQEENKVIEYDGNATIGDNLKILPVQATAAELYQSLYGNPDWVALPHFALAYCFILFGVALFVVLALNTRQLKMFYTYLFCASLIPLSYKINELTITQLLSSSEMDVISGIDTLLPSLTNRTIIFNYFAQAAIGYSLSSLLRYQMNNNVHWLINDMLPFSILIPSILILVGLENEQLRIAAMMAIFPPAIITVTTLWLGMRKVFRSIRRSFKNKYQILQHFGLSTFLETEWIRLQVPSLLRTFWLTRCAQQVLVCSLKLIGASKIASTYAIPSLEGIMVSIAGTAKDLLTRGNETTMAVLGMTSIVASICHHIGSLFHYVLTENKNGNVGGAENDEEKSVGSVSAVLFFVLALQTGLTSLEPDKRFARLCKNLCLLVTALFHFVHNMASPVLMSLSAARVINYRRHLRALSICLFLICAPAILMAVLWKLFPVGTWLLAVSAFCVEVVVKVLVTVIVYGLFLYDSRVREGTWEYLDDAVYYVRSLGNTVEFCFAVFLFFNGGWILLFESGGTIRALMMLIHAYCNIWCEAKSGKCHLNIGYVPINEACTL